MVRCHHHKKACKYQESGEYHTATIKKLDDPKQSMPIKRQMLGVLPYVIAYSEGNFGDKEKIILYVL
jgi:hypothetical protein